MHISGFVIPLKPQMSAPTKGIPNWLNWRRKTDGNNCVDLQHPNDGIVEVAPEAPVVPQPVSSPSPWPQEGRPEPGFRKKVMTPPTLKGSGLVFRGPSARPPGLAQTGHKEDRMERESWSYLWPSIKIVEIIVASTLLQCITTNCPEKDLLSGINLLSPIGYLVAKGMRFIGRPVPTVLHATSVNISGYLITQSQTL